MKKKKKPYKKQYSYHKKRKNYQVQIGIIILFFSLFLLSLYITKHHTTLSWIEKGLKDGVLQIETTLKRPIRYLKNEQKEGQEQKDLYKKYKTLEQELSELKNQETEVLELKEQIKQLQNTLSLDSILSENEKIHATVVTKNMDYWKQEITIDKGEKHGIEKGMPVIVAEGMIGTVKETSDVYSTVTLLSNEKLAHKISVKIGVGEEFVYGLLTHYNPETKLYTIEEIASNLKIEKGSVVMTTGMGSAIPSGIIIGYVKEVSKDHFDLAQLVQMESKVSFDQLDYVTVIKRKG